MIKIYNTLSGKVDEFKPIKDGEVSMYVCGPTVYNYIHIGNARPAIFFDTVRRYFEYRGYKVKYVQNFTDVDDKMIKRANEEGVDLKAIADKYIKAYFEDTSKVNLKEEGMIRPKATEHIGDMIEIIQNLIDKGHAYEADGDVYFDVISYKEKYGALSKQNIDDLQSGARIEVADIKKSPLDFALWKKAKEGEPSWDSPWGKGRPGWHIECSATSILAPLCRSSIFCFDKSSIFFFVTFNIKIYISISFISVSFLNKILNYLNHISNMLSCFRSYHSLFF